MKTRFDGGFWIGASGQAFSPVEMTTDHLLNTVKMLKNRPAVVVSMIVRDIEAAPDCCPFDPFGVGHFGMVKQSLFKYAQSLLDLRGNDFVICNDYGFPINPDSYAALVRRVGKKAGIEKIHPHMFRHTFVSILLSNPNIGVATVAAEAGHAQPSTTLAIYTQVYDRRRDEIRKQMSKELYK